MTNRPFVMVAALMLNAVWCQPKALAQCEATEHAKLLASDGTDKDFFGGIVAMSGDRVIVGDFKARPSHGGNRGGNTAYVLKFDGERWIEEGRLVPGDLQPTTDFGHSVAISGDVALVRAIVLGDTFGVYTVYVFRFDGQNWVEEDKLVASDEPPGVRFSGGAAVIGDRVLVGSPDTNAVYVFRFIDGEWTKDGRLTPSDGAEGDSFGSVLAVADNHSVVVGAPGDDDRGDDSGAAYVFRFDGTSWIEEAKLTASDGVPTARLGRAVAISGDTALLSARGVTENAHNRSEAYVFRRENGTWREEAKLTSVDNADPSGITRSNVAISGNVAVVAGHHHENENSTGTAYLFGFDGTEWTEKARLTASDAAGYRHFGASVALLDDVAIVGAPLDSDNGLWSGSVYEFRGLADCNQNASIDICEISTGGGSDCNANGIPDACDIAAGVSGDCQSNGVPDECELGRFTHKSKRLVFPPYLPEFTIPSPPPARGIVSLRFTIRRNPDVEIDQIEVLINGSWFAQAFVGPSFDEPSVATTDTLFMDSEFFNTAVDGGDAVISMHFAYVRHITLEVEYDAVGWGDDCNGNDVPDVCDVANGTSGDCQSDDIPDECNVFVSSSPQLSPVIHPVVQHHTIAAPPRAVGEVSLFFAACCVGDEGANESIDVDINGTPVGRVYRDRYFWDTPQLDVLPVPAALFNAAVGDGDAVINMTPTPEVNYLWPDSFVSVTVQYPVAQLADCQPNGISDACDLADGLSTDCDGDAVINMTPTPEVNRENPDSFVSVTVQYPVAQLADCQPNGISDACDLADGLSTDCDGDATPDECEPDADSDSIPDDCDQPGDFDHDADVDLADYKLLWVCLLLSGPGEPVPFAECREPFDADRDGDIDLQDAADFTRRLAP